MITQERLKEALHYNPDTGIFTWLEKSKFSKKKLQIAGCIGQKYVKIRIDTKLYLGHRLAWLYLYGEFPKKFIDHINGIESDNRIVNLRECSHQENMQNIRKPSCDNRTGFLGVSWHKKKCKYRARINFNDKQINLGYFLTAEEASEAYINAKRNLHEFCTI